jgi:predicted CoA-binding protein
MSTLPSHVTEFLSSRRVAVAGVSRTGTSAANAIFARLRRAGFDVFPINPHTTELEGVRAYPTITAIGTPVDGVVVATHPDVAVAVREAAGAGVRRVWFTGRSARAASRRPRSTSAARAVSGASWVGGVPAHVL